MAVFRTADNPASRTHSHDVGNMVDVFPRDVKIGGFVHLLLRELDKISLHTL